MLGRRYHLPPVRQPFLDVSIRTEEELDNAFAMMAGRNVVAVLCGATLLFQLISEQRVALAAPGSPFRRLCSTAPTR